MSIFLAPLDCQQGVTTRTPIRSTRQEEIRWVVISTTTHNIV